MLNTKAAPTSLFLTLALAVAGVAACDEAAPEGRELAVGEALCDEGASADEAATPVIEAALEVAAPAAGPDATLAATVEGGLDKDLIRRIVRAHISEIRHCYNEGLADDPELAGRVVVAFTIGEDGKVRDAAAEEVTITPSVAECSRVAVTRWLFPKPQGGGAVTVRYPFVLEPG